MPISDSLRAEISQYLIGQKLRALRLRRSMGLAQLGQRTGLSPALLSKIENSKLVPTVPTLLRVARVFDVSLDYFFQNEHKGRVVSITRNSERAVVPAGNMAQDECYTLVRLDLGSGERKFQPYLAEFVPVAGGSCKPHAHQGYEFLHVLRGCLQIVVGGEESLLHAGDSMYFDSSLPHFYRCFGDDKCVAFMVLASAESSHAERRMENLEGLRRPPQPVPAGNRTITTEETRGIQARRKFAVAG